MIGLALTFLRFTAKLQVRTEMQTIGKREHTRSRMILFVVGLLLSSAPILIAQTNSQKPPPAHPPETVSADKDSPNDDGPPLTSFEEEMRAKRAIRIAEKEHLANLDRAREISQLGRELQDSLKKRTTLDREDDKRLERLEKLTKKIRGEAGGGDDEVKIESRPNDLPSTVGRIVEVTECLSKNVQSTPRQVVSAAVIDNANVLLELLRMMRTFSR